MTHFNEVVCNECKEKLTMHASGVIACSCSFVNDPDIDAMPSGWDTTRENIYAMQLAESDYEDTE